MKTQIVPITSTAIAALAVAATLAGCATRESEYVQALPDRDTVMVKIPEATSANGLSTGKSARGIVGEPADLYTSSYYSARNLNSVIEIVIDLLETITAYKPTTIDDDSATWGPFSDDREPNEFILEVIKKEGVTLHYSWRIAGKHKSEKDDAYLTLAGGAFEPEGNDLGKGWFNLDFDNIHALNPAEAGRGLIGFAFARTADGVSVLAKYDGPDANGMDIAASYAYGEDSHGEGYVVFSFPGDLDDGKDNRTAIEDVLIRTRWKTEGGRADVVAKNGDLGAGVAQGSQCWDKTFVSTFEKIEVRGEGRVLAEAGDEASCVFDLERLPEDQELPASNDVKNPYELANPAR